MPNELQKDLVIEARELLKSISPLPWQKYTKFATHREPYSITDGNGAIIINVLFEQLTMDDPEQANGNAALLVRAPELLRQLADEVERLRRQVRQIAQDAYEDTQASANEAYWREVQGEDHGSY